MPGRDEVYLSVLFSKASKLHGGLVNRKSESSAGRHSAGEWPWRWSDHSAVQAIDEFRLVLEGNMES